MDHDQDLNQADDSTVEPMRRRKQRTMLGRFISYIAWSLLIFFTVSIGLLWFLYQSAQHIPDFYEAALTAAPAQLEAAGADFERNVAQLHNNSVQTGIWKAVFTQDQINGWLKFDLDRKFPGSLPSYVSEPRIALSKNDVKLAFRVNAKKLTGIIVAEGDLFCTEKKNQLGIRIKSVTSGVIPINIERWANEITDRLRARNIQVTWTESDGDPVALIELPVRYTGEEDLEIKNVDIEDQKVVLIGETILKTEISADLEGQLPSDSSNGENSTQQR